MKKYIPLLCIVVLTFVGIYLDVQSYLSLEAFRLHQVMIDQYMQEHYLLFILGYCMAYITIVGLSIPGASFMTLLGGILLGQWVGTMVVVISATIGASVIFISAKMASSNLIKQQAGPWIKKMQEGFEEDGFFYLLTIRLIPLFPFFIVNLASALFQISLRQFALATFFGIIPGTFVYVSIGVALREVIHQSDLSLKIALEPKVLMALFGFAILSLLPVIYKRFKR